MEREVFDIGYFLASLVVISERRFPAAIEFSYFDWLFLVRLLKLEDVGVFAEGGTVANTAENHVSFKLTFVQFRTVHVD